MFTKNTFGLLSIFLILISCQPKAYISGRLEGTKRPDTKVYIIKPETLREVAASYFGNVIDSALVDPEGRFAFHRPPTNQGAVLLELALPPSGKAPNYLETEDPSVSNYMPIIWHAGESLKITADANHFQKSFSMENPSENNKALLQLRDIQAKAYQTYLAGKQWHLEDGSQILDKDHATIQYQSQLMGFADGTQLLLPALVALRWVSPQNDYERVPEFLVRQCEKWKQTEAVHPWVEQLCAEGNPANLPVLVGSKFPNLSFPMRSKDTLTLESLLGDKLTLIDLWASWCAPCRKENREVFVPLWQEYKDKGLQIIAYGLESDEAVWTAAAQRDGAAWPQASHLQGDDAPLLQQMRVQTIPANFILDDKGMVLAKNLHGKALMDFVKAYMERQ